MFSCTLDIFIILSTVAFNISLILHYVENSALSLGSLECPCMVKCCWRAYSKEMPTFWANNVVLNIYGHLIYALILMSL